MQIEEIFCFIFTSIYHIDLCRFMFSMDQTELSVHDAEVNEATGISVIHDVV
jgi:hypothetical protein